MTLDNFNLKEYSIKTYRASALIYGSLNNKFNYYLAFFNISNWNILLLTGK